MAGAFSYRIEQSSTAKPDAIFDTLLDLDHWPDWVPNVATATWERRGSPITGEGGIRRTRMGIRLGGMTLREQIVGGTRPHHHAYVLLTGFGVLNNYQGNIDIEDRPNGSHIIWTATFTCGVPGVGRLQQIATRSVAARTAAALARRAEG